MVNMYSLPLILQKKEKKKVKEAMGSNIVARIEETNFSCEQQM